MDTYTTRSIRALALVLTSAAGTGDALAWDAGPAACRHTAVQDCSQGRGNTHLWIINNALGLLSQSSHAADRAIVAALEADVCRDAWEQGLWEMDCSDGVPGCSGSETQYGDPPALGSHFYNDNGKDYFAKPTSCPTYLVADLVAESCVFPEAAARKLGDIRLRRVKNLKSPDSCRSLGQALHYFTDTTMPFHASGLSGVSLFLNPEYPERLLHPTWENWVGTQHGAFPATGRWNREGLDGSADELFALTSRRAWLFLPSYFKAMELEDQDRIWSEESFPATRGALGEMLEAAYQATASYLHLALKHRVER